MDTAICSFVNQLLGKRLESLTCACEMLNFEFSEGLALHAFGLTRIIQGDDILLTTADYQSWDEADAAHNDEWFNAQRFREQIVGGTVLSAEMNPLHDLRIRMDNGITVECLIANATPHYGEEQDQWMLFEATGDGGGRFLIVRNRTIEFP